MYSSNYGEKLFEVGCILFVKFWILMIERSSEIEELNIIHATIHVLDAPTIYENEDIEVVAFIKKHIACFLPYETKHPEITNLGKKV